MAIEIGNIVDVKHHNKTVELFYMPKGKRIVSRVKTSNKDALKGFLIGDCVEITFYNNYNEVERESKIKGFDNNWLEKIQKL